MSESYYDSLVDCTLMIGINELSGVKGLNDPLLDSTYQQHILAAISSTVAIFPFSKTNYNYPPDEFKWNEQSSKKTVNKPNYKRRFSADEFHIINDLVSHYNKTDIQDNLKSQDLEVSLNRRTSRCIKRRTSIKVISLDNYKGSLGSVSIETIKSFPFTYFNNNLKISDKYVEPKIEVLPMTDNLGNRSYAFRLEFHRHFSKISAPCDIIVECEEIQVEPIFETDLDSTQDKFVPCNIVFFSKYPYFDLFKDILSQLFLSIANKTTTCIDEEILEYSAILTRIPIMKSGNIQIDFSINDITYSIKPNSLIFEQIIDWDMTILFQTLSLDDIVFVLTAMFQEQKIAFFSNHSNITTIICESLMILFQPFTWKHFYLTAVPTHLYELIDAIVPFMIGLPIDMKERVIKCYDDIIVVDLDRGTIHKPKTCNIAQISSKLIVQLKDSLCERDWLVFRNSLSNISSNSLKDLKSSQYEINKKFSEKIMLQFMMMMVDLFQEVLNNIIIEKKNDTLVANFDKYLATSNSDNVEFFKAVYRSDNFNGFLDSKLIKMDTDSWVKVCDNRYPELMNQFRFQVPKDRKSKCITLKSEKHIDSTVIKEKPFLVVSLSTSKNVRNDYYLNTIEYISSLNESVDVKNLKIDFYLQAGKRRKALELIQQLLEDNKNLLDISKIRKLVKGFDKEIGKEFKSLNSILEIEVPSKKSGEERKISVQQFNPPINSIPKKEFYEICKNADITQFEDVSDNFFNCLTLNQKSTKNRVKLVQPELFNCFYYSWILCTSHLNVDDINLDELLDEEIIIISSGCVKVDEFGQGRILLTQMRLLFVPFGKTDIKVMIDFSDEIVKKIKIDRRIRGFGKLAEVLEITKSTQLKKIVIWLKDETEVWSNLISEISVANRLSNEEKDQSILDKMIDQCLVYENLTNCSTSNPYFKKYCLDISKIMLTHSTNQLDALKSGDQGATSHRKYLICKLMPSPKQVVTIDCAATIYKPLVKNSDLWCAVTNGERYFIKIFQVISESIQSLQSEEIELMSRIKLMIHLKGTTKMFIGCVDGLIFLVNSIDLKKQEIDIGSDEGIYPMCAISHQLNSIYKIVFICTSNGEVLKCDQSFKQVEKIMTIPENGVIHFIEIYDADTLIMSSSHSIFIATTEGQILSVIELSRSKITDNQISHFTLTRDHTNIIIGLSSLPVFIEYNINNIAKPICVRMRDLVNDRDFYCRDLADMSEHFSKFVGLSSILSIENHNDMWLIYKDGIVEIINSTSLEKIDTFRAHDGILTAGLMCERTTKTIVFTVGKNDGKMILWNCNPS